MIAQIVLVQGVPVSRQEALSDASVVAARVLAGYITNLEKYQPGGDAYIREVVGDEAFEKIREWRRSLNALEQS